MDEGYETWVVTDVHPDNSESTNPLRLQIGDVFRVPPYLLGHRPPTRWERFLIRTRLARLRWR